MTAGKFARWICLADADEKIPDEAMNTLEIGAADRPPQAPHRALASKGLRPQATADWSPPATAVVSTGDDTAEPPNPPAGGGEGTPRGPGCAPPGTSHGTLECHGSFRATVLRQKGPPGADPTRQRTKAEHCGSRHCADFVDPQREYDPLLLTFWDG